MTETTDLDIMESYIRHTAELAMHLPLTEYRTAFLKQADAAREYVRTRRSQEYRFIELNAQALDRFKASCLGDSQ